MAYYNKQEILDYVSENLKKIEANGLKPLNPEAEIIKKLNDEEDMVGFFWIEHNDADKEGGKIKFDGKAWYRIYSNIYTDDRFAIDLYQAMKAGITVSDVIKKRGLEKEAAKKEIVDIDNLEQKIKESKKNGD